MLKRAIAGVAVAVMIAGCSGGGSSPSSSLTPQSKQPVGTANAASFRLATSADKAQQRPSLSVFDATGTTATIKSTSLHPMNAGGGTPTPTPSPTPTATPGSSGGGKVDLRLVTSLNIDNQGNLSEWSSHCKPSLWEAPWYFSDSNSSLTEPASITLPICNRGDGDGDGDRNGNHDDAGYHSMNSPQITPSPTPSPTPIPGPVAGSLYLVVLDIGWADVDVTTFSGPATVSGNNWVFPSGATLNFKDDHLYAFFVAKAVAEDCDGHRHRDGDDDGHNGCGGGGDGNGHHHDR